MPQKRTIDSFFSVPAKRQRSASPPPPTTVRPLAEVDTTWSSTYRSDADNKASSPSPPPSTHPSYPHPIAQLPQSLISALSEAVLTSTGRSITDASDLDLLYFQPLIPPRTASELFTFLRTSLPFYRVNYTTRRPGGPEVSIRTPRFTTVFGVDETARFAEAPGRRDAATEDAALPLRLVGASTGAELAARTYAAPPRPLPACLEALRVLVEACTGATYNFALVNYYASGDDSISYHSDDERFLGPEPAIASISLGAARDFLMRHKPTPSQPKGQETLKFSLASGDMVLMRDRTQSCWLHSIPKRKDGGQGRINITFRKALVRGGTDNYYRYNVGDGRTFRWNAQRAEMVEWHG